ncbi:PREDICTED: exosome complex component RRP40-like [Priapulus caudatus]|uniref:Ribosomal RNA-processing protein 40 n=1 Tax=Priapulus caudatus TaxID=37621 RepID=A0ABM1FAC7_PRICU|nr:PREDICTED: exosome complex component RRP40-like [Priapulus caudatus]
MEDSIGKVVIPGDILQNLDEKKGKIKVTVGPGLIRDGSHIAVTKSGILRHREPSVFWVDCHQKRYVPARGDNVIGIVTAKQGDVFKVDIGSSEPASLSFMAFEAATKRNRPNLNVGDCVNAKLLVANKDCEPELVCIDSYGRSSGLGILPNEGFLLQCSIGLVRQLLRNKFNVLTFLGKAIQYEVAIGMNGRIWLHCHTVRETIAISNAICRSELMSDEEVQIMSKKVVDSLQGFE